MPPDVTDTFEAQRDRLFGLAYRMLGDVAAAAGVSYGTASNTFNKPDLVNPELQARVCEAARKLGFSAAKTMMIAQQLYEGLELGALGTQGLITYMRTDSTRKVWSAAAQRAVGWPGSRNAPDHPFAELVYDIFGHGLKCPPPCQYSPACRKRDPDSV